jgi:hypothetical protein
LLAADTAHAAGHPGSIDDRIAARPIVINRIAIATVR